MEAHRQNAQKCVNVAVGLVINTVLQLFINEMKFELVHFLTSATSYDGVLGPFYNPFLFEL